MADIQGVLTNAGATLLTAAESAGVLLDLSYEFGQARRTPVGTETAIVTPLSPAVTGDVTAGRFDGPVLQMEIVDGAQRAYQASEIGIFANKAISGGSVVDGRTLLYYTSATTIIISKAEPQTIRNIFSRLITDETATTINFPASPASPLATEQVHGLARYGTDAEADAGTLRNVISSPFTVARQIASRFTGLFASGTEVIAGASNNKAIPPSALHALTATTTRRGLAEQGTQTEVNNGDNSRYVTGATLRGFLNTLIASITRTGLTRRSSTQEGINGTGTDSAMTPASTRAAIDARIVVLTQAQYNALTNRSASTVYVIT